MRPAGGPGLHHPAPLHTEATLSARAAPHRLHGVQAVAVPTRLPSMFLHTLLVCVACGFLPAEGICGTERQQAPRCWSVGRCEAVRGHVGPARDRLGFQTLLDLCGLAAARCIEIASRSRLMSSVHVIPPTYVGPARDGRALRPRAPSRPLPRTCCHMHPYRRPHSPASPAHWPAARAAACS
jgi:hypothetical protein